jgi:hypothetical protein
MKRFVWLAALLLGGVPLPAQAPKIVVTTRPSPLLLGQNRFDVDVKTATGAPVTDADVLVTITMPGDAATHHPEMRSEAKLKSAGAGKYTGIVMVTMAGTWNGEIHVRKAGKTIGRTTVTLKATERVGRP